MSVVSLFGTITAFAGDNLRFLESENIIYSNETTDIYVKAEHNFDLIGVNAVYNKEQLFVKATVMHKAKLIKLSITPKIVGNTYLEIKSFFNNTKTVIKIKDRLQALSVIPDKQLYFVGEDVKCSVSSSPTPPTSENISLTVNNIDNDVLQMNEITKEITANSAGKAEIICNSTDGSGLTSKTEIKVVNKTEGLYLQNDEIYVGVGDYISEKPTIYPRGAIEELNVSFSDNNILNIQDGKIIAINAGYTDVTFSAKDNPDIKVVLKVKVYKIKPTERQIQLLNTIQNKVGFTEPNVCQMFVRTAYEECFDKAAYPCYSAKQAMKMWSVSKLPKNLDNIPMCATIYCDVGEFGHVGFYDGEGNVIHQQDCKKMITPIEEFISYYSAVSYGWQNGDDLSKK